MSTRITRAGKASALTHNEMDTNLKKAAQTKAAAYTIAESDNWDTIEYSGAGTEAFTLPDAATVVAAADTGDFEVTIKHVGTGTLTIDRTTGADTIDGAAADITLETNEAKTLKVNQAGDGYISIADLTNNADTATAWETTRTISTSGDITSDSVNIDGSGNITITGTSIGAGRVGSDEITSNAVKSSELNSVAISGDSAWTISSGASRSPSAGFYMFARISGTGISYVELQIASTFYGTTSTFISGMLNSDGTNQQITDDGSGGSAIYALHKF